MSFTCLLASIALQGAGGISLDVDATSAPRDIIRSQETISVSPGKNTFVYAKWIPGNHGPTGPITQLIDLHFFCGGKEVEWRRDDVDMFAFHVEVPDGQSLLKIEMANVAATGSGTSSEIAWVNFNQVLLYPQGSRSDNVPFHTRLKLPTGWQFATALHSSMAGDWIDFAPVSLTRLVDSPVLSGAHFKKQLLDAGPGPSHEIDMAGDDEEAIQMPAKWVELYGNLAKEAKTLFGATHYNEYHWLVPVSDTVRGRGLEHHECSEDGASRAVFTGDTNRQGFAGLLAHEFTHSWCGKYRRPAGLATPNYQEPMKGELLYVYEGMTQYWGTVLPTRAGLWSKDEFVTDLAQTAAIMDHESGRSWKSVQDTAVASQISRGIRDGWVAERRAQDYYLEGLLIWLEADATIRKLSGGSKSLDDFCKAFFGPPSSGPMVRPYTFDDLVVGLNSIQPNDWRTFLRSRLDSHGPGAPLGGLEASGWKLVYTDVSSRPVNGNYQYSLGLTFTADGTVTDMTSRMPGDLAGIVPGQKIVGVNGKVFNFARIDSALKDHKPIDFLVQVGDDLVTTHVDYADGAKYPHLVREDSVPDLLSDIISSKAAK